MDCHGHRFAKTAVSLPRLYSLCPLSLSVIFFLCSLLFGGAGILIDTVVECGSDMTCRYTCINYLIECSPKEIKKQVQARCKTYWFRQGVI